MATIEGSELGDSLQGSLSDDLMLGLSGNDFIDGSSGNDTLQGGPGFDRVNGGSGNDIFIVTDRWDIYYETSGNDRAIVQFDFVKPAEGIEDWELSAEAKPLPYWIDALVAEDAIFAQKWLGSPQTFYYNFPITAPSYLSRSDLTGWSPLTAAQKTLILKAFDYIESIVDLQFIETQDPTNPNVMLFSNNRQVGSAAYAIYPSDTASGSDVFINAIRSNLSPSESSYAALALIHEMGHALGLKHPFEDGENETPPYLSAKEDNGLWTIMSYTIDENQYQLRFSPLDIAALQYLYGPSRSAPPYDNTYFVNLKGPNFIWDAAGFDLIEASWIEDPMVLSLKEGDWSWIGGKSEYITDPGQITINIGTIIEAATTGAGADLIRGNLESNRIRSNAGDDTIYGEAGSDTIEGGVGNDSLIGGLDNDLLLGGGGTDTARFNLPSDAFTLKLGSQDDASVSFIGPSIQIVPPPPTEGSDHLVSVERLQFSDKTITIETRSHMSYADLPDTLYQFFLVGFGAAPGVSYMDQIAEAYRYWLPEFGSDTVKQIVEIFTTKPEFTTIYPEALYRTEDARYYVYAHDLSQPSKPLIRTAEVTKSVFDAQMASLALDLVEKVVKASATAEVKSAAVADIQAALGLGGSWTIGEVIYTIFGNLASKSLTDPQWGGTAKQFANQVAVAKYYTDTLSQSTDDLDTLRSVIAPVTDSSETSSPEAITLLIGVALLGGPGI